MLCQISATNCIEIVFVLIVASLCFGRDHIDYRCNPDFGDPRKCCPRPNNTCQSGAPHSALCNPNQDGPKCGNFEPFKMTRNVTSTYNQVNNGIGHKVAKGWNIANMNKVHWSRDLEQMAVLFLQMSQLNKDLCLILGERQVKVNQNLGLRKYLVKSWPGRTVRSWLLEMGHGIKDFREFREKQKNGKVKNLTQILWPVVEFVGCGTVRVIVSYHQPPHQKQNFTEGFRFGKPCTDCDQDRDPCFHNFLNLCGLGNYRKTSVIAT